MEQNSIIHVVERPARILLIENDSGLIEAYTKSLLNEGIEVQVVKHSEDVLAAAVSFKPDLILLDVMMPSSGGMDILDILRNAPETAKTKIIILTAISLSSDEDRARVLRADDYLIKSKVVVADVIERIRYHLNKLRENY